MISPKKAAQSTMQGVWSRASWLATWLAGSTPGLAWPGLASHSPRKQTQSRAGHSWHPALLPSRGQCCPSLLALAALSDTQLSPTLRFLIEATGLTLCTTNRQALGLVFQHRPKLGSCTQGQACPVPKAGDFSAANRHLQLDRVIEEHPCQLRRRCSSSSRTLALPTGSKLRGNAWCACLSSLPGVSGGHCIPSLTL